MRFERTPLADAFLVRLQAQCDERGLFVRTWCSETFAQHGIVFSAVQANRSVTRARAAIRGMHFQRYPHADAKLVRVAQGRVHDVIVDLRRESPTRGRSFAVELSADDDTMLYVPGGCAHGFQTLTADVAIEYLHDRAYAPDHYDGFRFDDPAVDIRWPLPLAAISDRDLAWPPLAARMPWIETREPAAV
jgi:dTDP-4-dehydrorhamnose 3,5-epimerase